MEANFDTKILEETQTKCVQKLKAAAESLAEGVKLLDEVCDDLQPDSVIHVLLYGNVMPKIRELISNSDGNFSISDAISMITSWDLQCDNSTIQDATQKGIE